MSYLKKYMKQKDIVDNIIEALITELIKYLSVNIIIIIVKIKKPRFNFH